MASRLVVGRGLAGRSGLWTPNRSTHAPPAPPATTGLNFPGVDPAQSYPPGANDTIRFEFTSPMAAYPATYIFKCFPQEQDTFFWGVGHVPNDGGSFPGPPLEYYGFHPYPVGEPGTASDKVWEIAAGHTDTTEPPTGGTLVGWDQWYTCVAICTKGATSDITFYWEWPSLTPVLTTSFSNRPAPSVPAIIVGDAAWDEGVPGYGETFEMFKGVMRGFQFYDQALTNQQITDEIASPGSAVTPWYLNVNPTPTDISDKSGSGNHPAWVGTNRPTLWTG